MPWNSDFAHIGAGSASLATRARKEGWVLLSSAVNHRSRALPHSRARTLDDASDVVRGPECRIFASERPAWSEICDALPQFERLPGR
jgi:hypothetical protein